MRPPTDSSMSTAGEHLSLSARREANPVETSLGDRCQLTHSLRAGEMETWASPCCGHGNSGHLAHRALEEVSEHDRGRGGTRPPQRRRQKAGSVCAGKGKMARFTLGGQEKPCDPPCQSSCRQGATYFRHKARGCSGSRSSDPSEARNARGQASSIIKVANSSRMGNSVTVRTATWEGRGKVILEVPGRGASPANAGSSVPHRSPPMAGQVSRWDVPRRPLATLLLPSRSVPKS